jgi:hypothetical protein
MAKYTIVISAHVAGDMYEAPVYNLELSEKQYATLIGFLESGIPLDPFAEEIEAKARAREAREVETKEAQKSYNNFMRCRMGNAPSPPSPDNSTWADEEVRQMKERIAELENRDKW